MADEFDLGGRLRVDFSELEEIPERTEAAVAAADGRQIDVGVNTETAEAGFKRIRNLADNVGQIKVRPSIDALDISQTRKYIEELNAQWAELNAQPEVTLRAKVDTGGVTEDLRGGGKQTKDLSTLGGVASAIGRARTIYGIAAWAGVRTAQKGYGATVPPALQEAKIEKTVTRNFGAAQGQEFLAASQALSDATGFLASDFREAALAGKTLAAMSDDPAKATKLQTDAIKQLLPVAADIAATSPDKQLQTVAGAFTTLKAAIAGSASAQESLGVNLSDAYMETQAFGGALQKTWATLSEAEQAQLRYRETLNQTKDVLGEAGDETGLEHRMRQLKQSSNELAVDLGEYLVPAMAVLVDLVRRLVDEIAELPESTLGGVKLKTYANVAGGAVRVVGGAVQGAVNATVDPFDLRLPSRTTVIPGATAHPGARRDYYPAEPPPVQINLSVRREPGTDINLDSASWAPSNT